MTTETADEREEYSLAEQRIRLTVLNGGRGTTHVVEYRTTPHQRWPGRWTRRSASRRALCGALGALLVGTDTSTWPTERQKPADLADVTCRRCITRANRIFPTTGGTDD